MNVREWPWHVLLVLWVAWVAVVWVVFHLVRHLLHWRRTRSPQITLRPTRPPGQPRWLRPVFWIIAFGPILLEILIIEVFGLH
jgi:hypothetical protein